MVHYHRYHQLRKGAADEESQNNLVLVDCSSSGYYKRTRWPKLLSFLFLITFLSCCYVFAPLFLAPSSFTLSLSLLCKHLLTFFIFSPYFPLFLSYFTCVLIFFFFFPYFPDSPGTESDGNQDGVDVNASTCSSVSSGN